MENEFKCLVMNIVTPAIEPGTRLPVMVYIHGGSFLFGGANRPAFDAVNFISHSLSRGTPVVAVNFNYRVGLGGFLASAAIKADLERDGYEGVGNFGLHDQQVALHWVNRYIASFGGDPDNVTIYGESAGGISVGHHIAARTPAPFQRAIAMSGNLNTIPSWPLDRHEKHYRALLTVRPAVPQYKCFADILKYLGIDPESATSLDELRAVPQDVIARATLPVEGVFVCTGNPCDDGVFHAESPSFNNIKSPPKFLKSYMVGDTFHEGMILRAAFAEEDFSSLRSQMASSIGPEATDIIFALYEVTPELTKEQLVTQMEDMMSDSAFKTQNWLSANRSEIPQTFGYHFDQICTHESPLQGLSYHALDLLYLFLNFDEKLTPAQRELGREMANYWIEFAYGRDPWPRIKDGNSWMRFGPNDKSKIVTESEDDAVRKYSRMQKILDLGVYQDFFHVVDHVGGKRQRMGTFEWTPPNR